MTSARREKARILIVDDEPVVGEMLSRLLDEPGREIFIAQTLDQALEIGRRSVLDVALVDKNLGDASGLDLSRRLKRLQPEMEVILITGYASFDSAVEAVQIGAFDYLTKPIDDYAALSLKVRSAVEKCALRRGQKAFVNQLIEAEIRYRRLVEAVPDAVLIYDAASGKIEEANGAAMRLYGYDAAEMARLRISDLRLPVRSEPAGPGPARERHRKKSGAEFSSEVTSTEFYLEGRKLGVLSCRDVTEREAAERERSALEERLRISQKMEAIGRLAGGVAHDFNNLLAVIHAHSEFLADQIGPSHPSYSEVQGIARASARAAALTRQLLLFSRHKPVEFDQVDLNAVLLDLQRMLARVIGETVQLVTSTTPSLCPVHADANQLGQVIVNLVVNARDALPRGGRIWMRTENVELHAARTFAGGELPAGRYVSLTVQDSGVGMSAEVKARIFEPFFTTKEFGKGTGLGLATVYGIVRSCGGAIDVESSQGEGTTFRVLLPASQESAQAKDRVAPPPDQGNGESILLVEDEESLRALIRRILTANGYDVLEASNGEEGLRQIEAHDGPIDLLLTDIVMPAMGGRELADRLLRARADARVLYMTGYAEHAVLGEGVALLHKPFTTAALLAQIRKLLDEPRRRTA